MNSNSATAMEIRNMGDFITEKTKELALCVKLLHIQVGIKILTGVDLTIDVLQLIQSARKAIDDCEQVFKAFLNDPNSDSNYIEMFQEKAKVAVGLIEDVKKHTNFFRNKTIYADEILEDLKIATNVFEEIAG